MHFAAAQSGPTAQQADQQLNQSYQQYLRTLSGPARESLRKGERAWLAFGEKNSAAMRIAARELGISASVCQAAEIAEVSDRSDDFYAHDPSDENEQELFQRADAELNVVYKRCVAMLPPASKAALREAQRAWVDYRDANRSFGFYLWAKLSARRTEQLTKFYISATIPPLPEPSAASANTKAPPDPFERAR
jgi:uncharacterized protein YecT (DUF1311 family)